MNNILDLMKTPKDVNNDIVKRMRARRKEQKLTQAELSRRAGVSLGSLKRFEQTGNISLDFLIKIAFVLNCQEDFESLFAKKDIRLFRRLLMVSVKKLDVCIAIVGKSGMGALEYYPENIFLQKEEQMSLDEIAKECERIFETNNSESLDNIFQMGGSSGGARPKVYYDIDGEEWIVKFPSSYDSKDIGQQEYEYSLCAGRCGINMPETRLLNSSIGSGYFAVKRFDRQGDKKIHMVSVSGLMETSHRIPNLDYNQLMKLTFILTKSYEEVEKMYRLMCFNVFAHNRDDHSKNFSFIYNDNEKVWELSPAYDLTYSNSIGGEHATMVDGNGRNPGMKEILQVAENIQLDSRRAKKIAENIYEIVANDLKDYINQSYK